VDVNWRWLAWALVLLPLLAAGAVADPQPKTPAPPRPDKAGPADPAVERAQLMRKLDLLIQASQKDDKPDAKGAHGTPKPKADYPPADSGKSIDAVREGINLFRDGYFDAARRTFYGIEPSTLSPEDRVFVKYMLACSLRRMGGVKIPEAERYYSEVANSPEDEFLADCAKSQLALIRSGQELEGQLELLRSRVKPK
jgi:hypothetical protein